MPWGPAVHTVSRQGRSTSLPARTAPRSRATATSRTRAALTCPGSRRRCSLVHGPGHDHGRPPEGRRRARVLDRRRDPLLGREARHHLHSAAAPVCAAAHCWGRQRLADRPHGAASSRDWLFPVHGFGLPGSARRSARGARPVNRRRFLTLATAPFVLPAASAFGSTAPRGLVTCDTESRIAVVRARRRSRARIDPRRARAEVDRARRPRPRARVPYGKRPPHDRRQPDSSVRHVLHGFEAPRYTARHPDGVHAFVSDSGRGLLAAVDIWRGQVLGTVQLGGPARHLSLAPDGRTLWTSLGSSASQVAVVDVLGSGQARGSFVSFRRPSSRMTSVFSPTAGASG